MVSVVLPAIPLYASHIEGNGKSGHCFRKFIEQVIVCQLKAPAHASTRASTCAGTRSAIRTANKRECRKPVFPFAFSTLFMDNGVLGDIIKEQMFPGISVEQPSSTMTLTTARFTAAGCRTGGFSHEQQHHHQGRL
jgi:hypothetical protein